MKTYEAMFVFGDTLPEDRLNELTTQVRHEIEKAGGIVVETRMMGRRSFGRPLHKKQGGFYVRIDFKMAEAQVNPLRDRYLLMDAIFRFQIVCAGQPMPVVVAAGPAGTAAAPAAPASGG